MTAEITRVEIRPATPADVTAIAAVRRASWFAAYDGIIDPVLIDRATAPGHASPSPPYRSTIVALGSVGAAITEPRIVVGFASFGPERTVDSAIPPPPPPPPAGPAGPPTPPRGGGGTRGGLAV